MMLKNNYTFWVSTQRTQTKIDKENYNDNLYKVCSFEQVEDFWNIYQYMQRPSNLTEGCQILLFQSTIQPMWEDKENMNGGRFVYRCRGQIDRMWEQLILSFIGNQCQCNQLICGVVVNQKRTFSQVSIWVKDFKGMNQDQHEKMDSWVMDMFNVENKADLEFVPHPKQ